mmetsp:Transcript_23789/g.48748  ORF Transcript_23789/g.48748 Transcript_23789/m.48748 type:complete len:542 (+) Transcript_23789:82-1707(+)
MLEPESGALSSDEIIHCGNKQRHIRPLQSNSDIGFSHIPPPDTEHRTLIEKMQTIGQQCSESVSPTATTTTTAATRTTIGDKSLGQTWSEFKQALFAPADQDFNAFHWIFQLAFALLDSIVPCRDENRREKINSLASWYRTFIPAMGMILTLLCSSSYRIFHRTIVMERWCGCLTEGDKEIFTLGGECKNCKWATIHTSVVVFLTINIIAHYLFCIFRSPGIVVPSMDSNDENNFRTINNKIHDECNESNSTGEDNFAPHNCIPTSQLKIGGCCFLRSRINREAERERCLRYRIQCNDSDVDNQSTVYHPTPCATYCHKCNMFRPPRAHHCKICQVCVLQMDHHCPWVNNCIGYNNYRSFVLLIFYLATGCIYGSMLLCVPFFKIMKRHIKINGWSLMGPLYATGLLDLPPPWILWSQYKENGKVDEDVVLRAAFPFMLIVGILLTWFLVSHLKMITSGYTTLEHMARPDCVDCYSVVNPFDQGWKKNLTQILGANIFFVLFPWPIKLPSPCLPQLRNSVNDVKVKFKPRYNFLDSNEYYY